TDTYLKADLTPGTCVIIEDNARRSPKRTLEAVRDAGGTLVYVLGVGEAATTKRAEEFRAEFPDVSYLAMSELFGAPLLTEFSRLTSKASSIEWTWPSTTSPSSRATRRYSKTSGPTTARPRRS